MVSEVENVEVNVNGSLSALYHFIALNVKEKKDLKNAVYANNKLIRKAVSQNNYLFDSQIKFFLPNISGSEDFKSQVDLDLSLAESLSKLIKQEQPTNKQTENIQKVLGRLAGCYDEKLEELTIPYLIAELNSSKYREITSGPDKFYSAVWKFQDAFIKKIAYFTLMP